MSLVSIFLSRRFSFFSKLDSESGLLFEITWSLSSWKRRSVSTKEYSTFFPFFSPKRDFSYKENACGELEEIFSPEKIACIIF